MQSATKGKIGFLHLPAGVRNDIYTLSLAEDRPVEDGYIDIDYTRTRVAVPALLLASKQVRLEAGPIFYASNKFHCWGSGDAQKFLKGLKTEQLAALRHVRCMSFITRIPMSSKFYSYDFGVKGCFNWANDKLNDLLKTFSGSVLRRDAVQVPILVWGEQQFRWATCDELQEYEVQEFDGMSMDMIVKKMG